MRVGGVDVCLTEGDFFGVFNFCLDALPRDAQQAAFLFPEGQVKVAAPDAGLDDAELPQALLQQRELFLRQLARVVVRRAQFADGIGRYELRFHDSGGGYSALRYRASPCSRSSSARPL